MYFLKKMANRLRALESIGWNEENKMKIRDVLQDKAFNSSEYSESDDCSDNEGKKPKLVVRQLTWQRTRLTNIKAALDEHHLKSLSKRARGMITERERKGVSNRQLPKDAANHPWAVRLPATQEHDCSVSNTNGQIEQ